MREILASLNELNLITDYLNSVVDSNAIIFLDGDLASGKTTLTQNIVKSKGIDIGATSPTFALQHSYKNRVFHYDLYRVSDEEFMELGLFEEFDRDGWHIVEWGSEYLKKLLKDAGYNIFLVKIAPHYDKRKYTITKES